MGYMHNDEATKESIDSEGFLHSGDVGKVDADGFCFITGRIKELIITAGGENVPPVLIEDMIKEELPAVVSNVMVIGDKRKFLSCLLTLKSEPDAKQKPTDQLAGPALAAAKAAGSSAKTVTEAVSDPKFMAMIQSGINGYNKRSVSRAQHVQKFTVLTSEFTVDSGELTPTMKLKRKVVAEKFAGKVEAMYEGEGQVKASL